MRTHLTPRSVAQAVSYDSSTQSAALAATTRVVRLLATTNCHVAFGANPTATTANLLLLANVPEVFGVDGSSKIAAIKQSGGTAGILSIAEGPG